MNVVEEDVLISGACAILSDRAKTGWKADGVITGDYAAVYADWLKIFWNYRPVCGAASGFISKTVE